MTEAPQNGEEQFSKQIGDALDKTLQRTIDAEARDGISTIDTASARIIIFSDHHKGARNLADDFLGCEQVYNAALAYYFDMGHTLITLGDVEEFWEETPQSVLPAYDYTLNLEAQFHRQGRYYRFWGNHDNDWSSPDLVRQLLNPIYSDPASGGPPLQVRESLRFKITEGSQELGSLFLAHGHQGTVDSDFLAPLSKFFVRIGWRTFQNLTGVSRNTPARNWQLRNQHNLAMYEWISKQKDMLLVVGHTHRPVFLSRTHAEKTRIELARLEDALHNKPDDQALREQVSLCAAQLEWILSQERQMPGPEGTVLTPKPCYFNTGCCCFCDGDITGIEIFKDEIRLVRWPDDDGSPKPKILECAKLKDVFTACRAT